jgi:hypothetical protein
MHKRCYNPNATGYDRWGGRGIVVDTAWHNYSVFLADMGERSKGMSLDRIDNDGNYSKANCRWVTAREQNLNRRAGPCVNGCTCKKHLGKVYVKHGS